MKDEIQYKKAENKITLLTNLIEDIIDYNNTTNYDNIKKYRFKINYTKLENNLYLYEIKVLRGTNRPTQILNIRLQYKEKINELLLNMINTLLKNNNFNYTSYKNNYGNYKYSLNFFNQVSIELPIKDAEDTIMYEKIESNYKNKVITEKNQVTNLTEEEKDKLQIEKANKILNIVNKVLENLYNLNNIENYNNTKQFKLILNSRYENLKKAYAIDLLVTRGEYNKDALLDLSLSIKDITLLYSKIYDLMINFVGKKEFMYNAISTNETENNLSINLRNGISLIFNYNNETDKLFYNTFFKEYRNDLLDNKIKKSKELK